MKTRVQTVLAAMALLPLAALAAESSPQSRCLEKVSRQVQAVSAQLARLNVAEDKPVQAGVRYPAAGLVASGNYFPVVTAEYMYNLSFNVPPSEGIYRRELVLLSLRMSECSRLPASNEDVKWRVQVDRAGATRRM